MVMPLSVERMASSVHHLLTPEHEILLGGDGALKECPTLKI
jgi:hypothetical protein